MQFRQAVLVASGLASAAWGPLATAQEISDAVVGVLSARQVDSSNSQTGVVLTIEGGATRFSWSDRNRGDYDVGFGTGNDLDGGVTLAAVRNLGRDNDSGGDAGGNNGGDLFPTVSISRPGSRTDWFVSVFGAPSGEEMNADVSAVHFPFDAGFIGGQVLNTANNGPMDRIIASPGIDLVSEFSDPSGSAGIYSLDLRTAAGADGTNGVLLACGLKNEDNYALVHSGGDGQYTIYCKDNGSNGSSFENDPVAFVYLPYDTPGLVAGRVAESSGVAPVVLSGTAGFSVSSLGAGRVLVEIDGVTDEAAGAFLITPEGGLSLNQDNIVVCEWDAFLGGFVVETHDIPGMGLQGLAGQPMFSFAYIPVTAGSGFGRRPGTSTLAVIPDTQLYAQDHPHIFESQTRWIDEVVQERDIRMVMHLGDITNRNNAEQWQVARDAFDIIHPHVPFILAQGNHDIGPNGNGSDRTTLMNQYFPLGYLQQLDTFGGVFEFQRVENSYHLFEAAGRKWIVIGLEWGPRDVVLPWANALLEQHADRLAVIITHAYMYNNDTRIDHEINDYGGSPYNYGTANSPAGTNDGGDLWRKLVSLHPNTVMVISGHIKGEGLQSDATAHGNVVHQMLCDYQGRPEGGEGFLRLYEMVPGSSTIEVRTYSPYKDRWLTGTGNHFDLELITAPGHSGLICDADLAEPFGVLDLSDISAFVTLFSASDPTADFDGNGVHDLADVTTFITAFTGGCP